VSDQVFLLQGISLAPNKLQQRVIGWVHPDRDSINGSRVFYVKTMNQPWLETTDLSHGQLQFSLDVSHDVEMRQVVDETIERFIQGGD